jgi:hypothetical protein
MRPREALTAKWTKAPATILMTMSAAIWRRARRKGDNVDDSINASSEEEEEEENDDGDCDHQRHVRETRVLREWCDQQTYNDVDFHRNLLSKLL